MCGISKICCLSIYLGSVLAAYTYGFWYGSATCRDLYFVLKGEADRQL